MPAGAHQVIELADREHLYTTSAIPAGDPTWRVAYRELGIVQVHHATSRVGLQRVLQHRTRREDPAA